MVRDVWLPPGRCNRNRECDSPKGGVTGIRKKCQLMGRWSLGR